MFSLATVHIFWAGFWPGGHVKHADNVGVEKQRERVRERVYDAHGRCPKFVCRDENIAKRSNDAHTFQTERCFYAQMMMIMESKEN